MLRTGLIALLCSLATSCAGMVASSTADVGVIKYHQNEYARDFDQDLEHAWLAVLEVMNRLGYGEPLTKELLPLEGRLEFTDAVERIQLRLESQATDSTRLIVRVGKYDNKAHRRKALIILEEVAAILECDEDLRAWTEKVRELEALEPDASETQDDATTDDASPDDSVPGDAAPGDSVPGESPPDDG